MTLKQLLAVLRARWILIASLLLVVVLTTAVVSFRLPKTYTSTASVVLDVKSPDPIIGSILPGMSQPGYMGTQVDIIRSERVAKGVIKELSLDKESTLRTQWKDATGGISSFDSWLANLLLSKLDVAPARESSVINITYTAVEPQFAALIANAFVRNYIKTTLELRVEPARQYASLFEEQSKLARTKLEAAQTKLSEYQRKNGLIVTDERVDVENARLNDLSGQYVSLQGLYSELSTRRDQARSNSSQMTEVLVSSLVSSLKGDLVRQEARLKEMLSSYGEAHPQVQQARASVAELKARLDVETRNVVNSLGVNSSVTTTRVAEARAALDKQREKLLQTKALRDEASILLREVESAQRALDSLQARFYQTSLESSNNQTNVSVMKVASPAAGPSGPNVALNTALAAVVGLVLSVGGALALEFQSRRLRVEDDAEQLVNLPVLASLGRVQGLSTTPRLAAPTGLAALTSNTRRLGLAGPKA